MNETNQGLNEILSKNVWLPMRAWFYLVTPEESTPKPWTREPDFLELSGPLWGLLILIEVLLNKSHFGYRHRMNDMATNVAMGCLGRIPIVLRFELIRYYVYPFVYNYRLIEFDYYSKQHWVFAALVVDFLYYWAHRFLHEWNIGWAAHSIHHSSEDYNLTTALRQSVIQLQYNEILLLPCALLGIHWTMFYTHYSINLTFQFWIHTEIIRTLGPFELIFNTPSHHRVHHGRNPFCIDKNYAGVLIIWDRIFGTFASEDSSNEKIQYGLVQPAGTFDVLPLQFDYTKYVLTKVASARGFGAKLRALFFGPGFDESEPQFRLGNPSHIPTPDVKYTPYDETVSVFSKVFAFTQVLVITHFMEEHIKTVQRSEETVFNADDLLLCIGTVLTLMSCGARFSKSSSLALIELLRFSVFIPCVLLFYGYGTFSAALATLGGLLFASLS